MGHIVAFDTLVVKYVKELYYESVEVEITEKLSNGNGRKWEIGRETLKAR